IQITTGTVKVVLSDNANGYVIADAIRLSPGSSGQSVPKQPSGGGPSRPGAASQRLTVLPLIVATRTEQVVNIAADGQLFAAPPPPTAPAPVGGAAGTQARVSAPDDGSSDGKRELPEPF